jgi:hypothetical protein
MNGVLPARDRPGFMMEPLLGIDKRIRERKGKGAVDDLHMMVPASSEM